jgi:hypothetical protein
MPYFTSRAQDCAERIKEARAEVDKAQRAYSRGGSVGAVNAANARLAAAHNDLYVAASGLVADDR